MGMKIAGIDIVDGVLNAEFRILVLEKIVERLVNKLGDGFLTQVELEQFRDQALKELQEKYPDAGVKKTKLADIYFETGYKGTMNYQPIEY